MKKVPVPVIVITSLSLLLLIVLGSGLYYFFQYQKAEQRLMNPDMAAKEETQELLKNIGKVMLLPNEDPTVATISDKDKLSDQAFFSESQNGDQVLVFPQAKKAILWRPSTHMIINVAPVFPNPQQKAQESTTSANTPSPSPTGIGKK